MELVDGALSGAVKVGKLVGSAGFAIVKVDDDGKHGEVKAFTGDHVVEVSTTRPAIYGEPEFDLALAKLDPPGVQKDVTRVCRFVLTSDAATACGVFLEDEPPVVEGIPATGATAGNPGSFTPSGATVPADLAGLAGVTASPASGWLTGEHVVLGDTSHASWDGAAWIAGDGVGIASLSSQSTVKQDYSGGKSKIVHTK